MSQWNLSKEALTEELSTTCQLVFNGGFTPGKSGNISARLNQEALLVTPSGWSFMNIQAKHVVEVPFAQISEVKINSENITLKPSSELPVHQAIYQNRPDVGAVIHAHPPKATAFAVAGRALEEPIIPELTASLGQVPLVDYFLPGSKELAEAIGSALKAHHAILMANHGVITVGKTLEDAFFNLQLLESYAEIVINCQHLGRMNVLNDEQVQDIYKLRDKMKVPDS